MHIEDFAEKQSNHTEGKGSKWIVQKPDVLLSYLQQHNNKPSELAKALKSSYSTIKRFLIAANLWDQADVKKQSKVGGKKRTATQDKNGYLYAPKKYDYVDARGDKKRRFLHQVNAEQKIGRPLANKEMVHHINLNKQDNRPENLMVCSNSEHKKIHHNLEQLAGRLMEAGYIDYVPELNEYIYVGPTIKLQREVQGGFVRIVDVMGNDATVVNSARVSFGNMIHEIRDKDLKLIDYLANNGHTSPFRHCYVQFHVKAPEFVARQWYKHVVGSEYSFKDQPWNEISGRYVKLEHEFWEPEEFRIQSESNKQASIAGSQIDGNEEAIKLYKDQIASMFDTYEKLLATGVAKEQARVILPLSFMTEWYWTASLQTIAHFVNLRDHTHAQIEIRDFAVEIDEMMYKILPNTWKALRNKSK